MGAMNAHYGSELHLLRMLGRHRNSFNRKILSATGAESVQWLDFPGGGGAGRKISDQFGIKNGSNSIFFRSRITAREVWIRTWPTRKGPHWDAVGKLRYASLNFEWLLVEAKANVEELASDCGAKSLASLTKIRDAMTATKKELGVADQCDGTTNIVTA
jgi:hypothetical protein